MLKKSLLKKYIDNGFDVDEAASEIDFVIELATGISPMDLMLGNEINNESRTKIIEAVNERLSTKRPIQQILGQAYFMGAKYFVNEHTLIPRPETELVVQEVVKLLAEYDKPRILDIGTGSGCIAIEIAKKLPSAKVLAVDICENALKIAQKNAILHKVSDRIEFLQSDLFENVEGYFDLIVSNPPYIPLSERDNLQEEVKYDPYQALFTQDEYGIEFYKKIVEQSKTYFKGIGNIVFELGIKQYDSVELFFKFNKYSNIIIVNDLDNIQRVISAKLV